MIQWCLDDECTANDSTFDCETHEVVANSLEEAIVIMRDIENADGRIDKEKK